MRSSTRIACIFLAVVMALAIFVACASMAYAKDITVSPADGSASFQRVMRSVKPGDTITVHPGDFDGSEVNGGYGFKASSRATKDKPIILRAEPGTVTIHGGENGLTLLGCDWWIVDGIVVDGAKHVGFLITDGSNVTVRRCKGLQNGVTGLLSGFCDDIAVLDGEWAYNAEQHGIYVGNGGDRPVIRGNLCHHNGRCGVQNNADPKHRRKTDPPTRGDGLSEDAVVEGNRIWECGLNGAGAAIQFLSCRGGRISNNDIRDCYGTGIMLSTDIAGPNVAPEDVGKWGTCGVTVSGNTIIMPASDPSGKLLKRGALVANNASTGNTYSGNTMQKGGSPAVQVDRGGELVDGGGNTVKTTKVIN